MTDLLQAMLDALDKGKTLDELRAERERIADWHAEHYRFGDPARSVPGRIDRERRKNNKKK